jgi:hypothetical protein
VLPSHTFPLACVAPKPDPTIVTCIPAVAVVGVTLVMFGAWQNPATAEHTDIASTAKRKLADVTNPPRHLSSEQVLLVPVATGRRPITPEIHAHGVRQSKASGLCLRGK